MKRNIIIIFLFFSQCLIAQKNEFNAFLIDYSYQFPIGILSEKFGNNSSIGINYLKKEKNNFFYGIKLNYIFGGGIKDSTIFSNISTDQGYVIDGNGTYANIILLQEGFNTNLYAGYAYLLKENNPSGFYFSVGLGFLQHRIIIDTKNQYIPHLNNEYKKGYDQLTNGLSIQFVLDYILIEDKNRFKMFAGIDYTIAYTKNRRPYDFNNMISLDEGLRIDQLLGLHIGLIFPINRKNTEEFHYY
jgi:hypothetical protein